AALDAQVDAAQRLDAAVALAYAPQLEHPSFVSLRRRRLPRRLGALAHRGSVAQFVIMESGDAAPTAAQAEWMRLGYGMFAHFGPWTWSGQGDGKFPAAEVHAPALDMRAWARLAAESGMRYAVLTAKHVDGFCLWPSQHTTYSVAATPARRDLVAEFVDAFAAAGLAVGLYYALLDRHCPFFEDDARYAQYVRDQIDELLGYGDL